MKKCLREILHLPARSQLRRYTRTRVGNFFYFLFLFAAGAFSVLPMIYCIATSFKPLDELLIFPPTLFTVKRPTIANYLALPDLISSLSVPLSRYVFNSVFIAAVGTALCVLISAMGAFVLSKTDIKYKSILFTVIQFSLLFNTYTLAIPQYIIYSSLHVINTYWVYLLPTIASSMGVFLMKQYMESALPDALMEAAEIDGAGPVRIFFEIAMPIVKPCWLTLTMFGFRDVWAAIPDGTVFNEALKTLPTIMSQVTAGGIARSGSAMAVTVIMMVPPILVYLVSQSNVIEAMSSAGIKE